MEGANEGSCDCVCDCNSSGNDNVSVEDITSAHILGSTHNSIDLWVSTPAKTKWSFVEEKDER